MGHNEHLLVEQAVATASRVSGLDLRTEQATPEHTKNSDAVVVIHAAGVHLTLQPEIRQRLSTASLGAAVAQTQKSGKSAIIIAQHINRSQAERLRELNVSFLDAAGNMFINVPPVFILVTGRPPVRESPVVPASAFNPTGLQVIFALLVMPDLVMATYRDIARASGVSLGMVGRTMTGLEQTGFILTRGRRDKVLTKSEELRKRWVQDYADRLRPRLLLGRFSPTDPDWTAATTPRHFQGAENAAAILTGYLNPAVWTYYLNGPLSDFVLTNRLRKDPQGRIECRKAFWNFPGSESPLTPPLLIYADLLASGDPRNIETAQIVHDRFLR